MTWWPDKAGYAVHNRHNLATKLLVIAGKEGAATVNTPDCAGQPGERRKAPSRDVPEKHAGPQRVTLFVHHAVFPLKRSF